MATQTIPALKSNEPPPPAPSPFPWKWIAALTALAGLLRLIGLNQCLWWDEIYFLMISVRHPLSEIVTVFPADTQHTLYSILAKFSVLAFGEHAWSLRLPAAIFGAASIPVLYLLAAAVTSRKEALLASALLAASYHHVWFSQNARGYSGLAFWTLLATLFLLRGIQTGRRGPYLAYAVAAALGVYTHLTMMFLIASHGLICAVIAIADRGRDQRKWKLPLQAFALTGVLILALYAPVLTQVQKFFLHHPSAMRAVSTPRWAFLEIVRGLVLSMGGLAAVAVIAGLIVAAGAWSYFKQNRLVFSLFALPGVVTALGAVLARGTMYPRFYFSLISFAILILVRGVIAVPELIARRFNPRLAPPMATILASLLLVASGVSLLRNYQYPKQDFEGAARFLEAQNKDGEAVITAGATTYPMREYYAKPWGSIETVGQLEELCARGRPFWLIYTFPRYLEAAVPGSLKTIQERFTLVREFPGTVGDGAVYVSRFNPR